MEEILKNANEVLDKSRHIDALFTSAGWKIYCEILEEELAKLKDISNTKYFKTLTDLKANQRALRIWKNIANRLLSLKDGGTEATKIIEKLKKSNA